MQEPITVLTNLPILLFSLYAFLSLLIKNKLNFTPTFIYSLFFLFLLIMSLCGTLFHINNSYFYALQQYGTMIAGGLLSTTFALATIFDNFENQLSIKIGAIPFIFLVIYLFNFNINSFLPFIFLQLANIVIVLLVYAKNIRTKKAILIYTACVIFVIAGIIQTQAFKTSIFNHNDIFHIISLISAIFLYKGITLIEQLKA